MKTLAPTIGPLLSPLTALSLTLDLLALLPLTLGPLPCRLSWNLLGDEAAAELAQVLPQMGRLKRVEYEGPGEERGGLKGDLPPGNTKRPPGQSPASQKALP